MRIGSSSMSPTLKGPHHVGHCSECQNPVSIDADEPSLSASIVCPFCGTPLEDLQLAQGDQVEVVPYRVDRSPQFGDVCVFRDPQKSFAEVKRIAGRPGQRVHFNEGDLWVDGQRVIKSEATFLESAIKVCQWTANHPDWIEKKSEDPQLDSEKKTLLYQHQSQWPKVPSEKARHPSVILDEYPNNPLESRYLLPVADIGVLVKLQAIMPKANQEMVVVKVWSKKGSFQVSVYPDNDSLDRQDVPLALLVAYVDGRWLTKLYGNGSNERSFHLDQKEILVDSEESSDLQSTCPVAVHWVIARARIEEVNILRDIFYRGPDGEVDYELPVVDGFTVLGDNVSNSLDSRTEFPEGVDTKWILGRINFPNAQPTFKK